MAHVGRYDNVRKRNGARIVRTISNEMRRMNSEQPPVERHLNYGANTPGNKAHSHRITIVQRADSACLRDEAGLEGT